MEFKFSVERKKDFYDLTFNEFIEGKWLKKVEEVKKEWNTVEIEYSKNLLIIRKAKDNK